MASKAKFSLEAIFKATDRLTAPMAKIQTKLGAFGKKAKSALGGANNVVNAGLRGVGRFSDAIGIAGVASVAGLGYALHDAMEKGIEFEDSLIRAGAALEVPVAKGTAGFAKLSAAARVVGKTTEHSAQIAAASLEVLATAGYNSQQAIGALPKIADFATAGKLELADASEVAAATLGSFNLKVADAAKNSANMARVIDVLVRSSADSSASVAEMFEAIKMGGPAAAGVGASIENFAAAANVLADSGVKGSMAGTALRNVFVRLAKQTPAATKVMKRYGIAVAKNKDGSIDMAGTVDRFNKKLAKASLTQRAAALDTIFGSEAMTAFQSLMAAGPAKIDAFTSSLENASGTAKTMADTVRSSSTGVKLAMAKNKLEDFKLTVFESLAPLLLDVADAASTWATANDELITAKTGEWFAKLKESLPEIVMWIKRAGIAVGGFIAFAAVVKVATVAVAAFEVAMKLGAGGAWLFGKTLKGARWAVNANTIATVRLRVATVALRIATLASRGATLAMTAAQWAYTTPLKMVTLATVRQRLAHVALRVALFATAIAQAACRAAVVAATAVQAAYTAVVAGSSGGLVAFRVAALASVPAITAQGAAMVPLIATLAAATAAVGALVVAWQQYNALDKELAGSGGITGTVGKMWDMGTFDPFAAHDAAMNEKAQADRREREKPQIVSPAARAASEAVDAGASSTSVDGRIVVEATQGTKAQVKSKSRNVPLVLEPSGAF